MPNRTSDAELLAGILRASVDRLLEQEGVFHAAAFGDMAVAGELDWDPGTGPVYVRRLAGTSRHGRPRRQGIGRAFLCLPTTGHSPPGVTANRAQMLATSAQAAALDRAASPAGARPIRRSGRSLLTSGRC
ncbi:hypothetical protein EAS64_03935 [Trebonia kvetii]|uniref:Uncharacterized protein n=1 Tax=Trebonia kvetii TaxID=2480626 RepID=A0A6P2C5L6_9ACTN|nr:hypothetical protein [Trebonia kvetii]TVZ06558.1 hypothetical protein EAS64_03935 [Trebonia kvetii]